MWTCRWQTLNKNINGERKWACDECGNHWCTLAFCTPPWPLFLVVLFVSCCGFVHENVVQRSALKISSTWFSLQFLKWFACAVCCLWLVHENAAQRRAPACSIEIRNNAVHGFVVPFLIHSYWLLARHAWRLIAFHRSLNESTAPFFLALVLLDGGRISLGAASTKKRFTYVRIHLLSQA